ncbi:putative phosphate transport system substrate-binding protein [Nostoc sp. HK-01]|nr:putative phosphate transport system substrate-binding protein [Nostoc sp. HK-01]
MGQQQKKDSAIVNLALTLALATTPMAATLFVSTSVLAQSATDTPSFSLPQTVENGSTVRVDGSSSLALINQNLKAGFEKQFAGTKVEVANNGTDAAIKAVLEGKTDIAAIGRGLTPEEKAQGLEQVRLHREKIAIIVGEENPFKGSLTDKQFARIFRGKSVTDWSQLGGTAGKIRVIDRPDTSDTRQALNNYPVFKAAKFATSDTATKLTEDNTAEIVKQLGKDGISYARVNQISKLPGVRVLQLHQALPNDPKYPFSQPLVYVYKKNPSPAVAGFLGFALAKPGKQAIETARTEEADAIAKGESPTLLLAVNPPSPPEATPQASVSPFTTAVPVATTAPTATAPQQPPASIAPATTSGEQQPSTSIAPAATGEQQPVPPAANNPIAQGQIPLWWLLLPVGVIAGLLLWMIRTSPSGSPTAEDIPPANPQPPAPEIAPAMETTAISEPVAEVSPTNWANGNGSYNGANVLEGTIPASTTDTAVAIGTGAVIGSIIVGKNSENHQAEDSGYDLGISPWDMEAPAAVVNTSYPPMIDRSKTTANSESSTISDQQEATPATVEVPPEITPVAAVHQTETETNVTLDLPEIPENSIDEDDWGFELTEDVTEQDSQLDPEIEKLNFVADAAEPELEPTEELIVTNSESLPSAGMGDWSGINLPESAGQIPTTTTTEILAIADPHSSVTLTPKTHDLADVTWEISATGQQIIHNAGLSQFILRLYDVTDIDMSYQQPHLVQQYECEITTSGGSVAIPQTERDYVAAIGYETADNGWVTLAHSQIARVFGSAYTNPKAANVVLVDETSTVTLTPSSHQLADIAWHISDTSKQMLQNAGIFQLALRLYDVTNIDMSYQQPQLVQQYEFDFATSASSVGIPIADHDYIAEIGYLIVGDRWVSIARSPIVRVFSPLYTEDEHLPTLDQPSPSPIDNSSITLTSRTPKWAYAAWEISETRKQMLQNAGILQLALRLYDATDIDMSYQQPQLIQQYECEEITHDRYVAIPTSDRDYMIELGYATEGDGWVTIARSTAVRIFSRPQRDFWFVADAELIIHGATEPNATVNIAGNPIALKPDGTFHLRVPFSENLIDYLMTAVAADGEKSKTIHKKFSQEVPEA